MIFPILHFVAISIHALLAESDLRQPCFELLEIISIHALLAESDHRSVAVSPVPRDFNPRSPCGERRMILNGLS